jgi:hypothetical protein
MSAMVNGHRAWRINDCDTYAGRDVEEAIAKAMADTGIPRGEIVEDPVTEVSRAVVVADADDPSVKTTVGAILDAMDGPGLVCSTEY